MSSPVQRWFILRFVIQIILFSEGRVNPNSVSKITDEVKNNAIQPRVNSAIITTATWGANGTTDYKLQQFLNSVKGKVSKITDENGEPQVVFHGTNKSFNTFKTANEWGYGGAYFSANRKVANSYNDFCEYTW